MQCPNCGAEVREGAAFCGSCGEAIAQAPAAAADVPGATVPMTATGTEDAEYARQMAEYERQKAAYDQQQYAQQQYAYEQQQAQYAAQGAQPTAPPKKSKTGLIIAIVVILVLVLGGCGVGGYFAYKAVKDAAEDSSTITDPDVSDTDDGTDGDAGNLLDSYATADEAVMAQLEASGVGDWVYQLYDEGDGYATYWAGPPNSEFVDEIYLEQNADGTWSVIEVSSLDYGGDVSDGMSDASAEAILVVDQHLSYVMNDQGLEAQTLTVDPFYSDSASAQVSGGGFDYYEIIGSTDESDGTVWVQTTQSWYGTVEDWEYWVVPTEAGYRIADIRLM